ncbi:MAG: T9SS type A sorting domain-containing protein [Chlorobi bacterium]|nr:T9SS type A sorting domain-containing protein [Chlorobiota bacterium]
MKKSALLLSFFFMVNLSFSQIISQGSVSEYLDDGSGQGIIRQQSGVDPEMDFTDYSLFRKAPYLLFTGNNDEMLIVWQLDSTKTCHVEWGTDTIYADGSVYTEEYGDDHQHKTTLTGLTPNTKYFYRVSCDNTNIEYGSFISGAEESAEEISFYAYGDTRTNGGIHNQVAKKILDDMSQHPGAQTFIISSGDLVSNGNNESDWQNQFFSPDYGYIREMLANLPYMAAMGNHEGQGVLFHKYFPYPMFVSSRYYYSFDYGPAHFTVIDQFTSYGAGSAQYEWMVNDLASTDKNWKIMVFHEPGWSAGGGHPNNTQVQNVIQPLCVQYGVQLVINGHNHYYARAVVNGIDHITTGGGGAPLYNPNPNADSIVIVSRKYHYCRVDIAGDTLTYTVIDKDGNVIETFERYLDYQSVTINPERNLFKIATTWHTVRVMNKENIKGVLSVYDTFGHLVNRQQLLNPENSVHIDIPGIYFVRIDYEGERVVKKIFVR